MTLKEARQVVNALRMRPGQESLIEMIEAYEAEILRLSAILADEILETEGLIEKGLSGITREHFIPTLEVPLETSLEEEISKEFKESEEEEY